MCENYLLINVFILKFIFLSHFKVSRVEKRRIVYMIGYLKKIPIEIISKIFAYTHSPQSDELTNDIRNYVQTFDEISYIYYNFWIEGLPFPIIVQTNQDKQWLFRDLFNHIQHLDHFFIGKILKKQKEETKIRLIWGAMTTEQRNEFVEIRKKLMIDDRLQIIAPAF
ncbi:MAG: hypothetical protein CL678_01890 [Bdellovibrionaceae bacterium]|nr:hypothetical protein [Pseudobdellovibrionaceae bacterium]